MSTDPRAGVVTARPGQLQELARELHGRDYRALSDEEASAVWDEIERRTGNAAAAI